MVMSIVQAEFVVLAFFAAVWIDNKFIFFVDHFLGDV